MLQDQNLLPFFASPPFARKAAQIVGALSLSPSGISGKMPGEVFHGT